MSFSEVFVRRPVMAVAINAVLFIVGIVCYYQLELRHIPKMSNNELRISTLYPGANSYAVEHQVTKPLEDALAGLDGISKLNSASQDGESSISIKFKTGVNADKSLGQVRDRILATMSSLPESVKRPEISEQGEANRGILYMIFEDDTRSVPALSDYIRRVVEDRLRLVDGVASIGHYGNQFYIVAIKPDPARLVEHEISVKEVVDALRRERVFASGGEVEGVTTKESVVITAMVTKPEDFSNVTIKMKPNERITIGHVAEVSVSERPTFLRMRVNGRYVVGLEVIAKPQANPLEVARRVEKFVQSLKPSMPPSMKAYVSFDATRPFFAAFVEMRHTLWEAIALVGIIMALSLGSIRAALMPMVTIPLCLVGTFAVMWLLHFSINPVTLLALVLSVGLVVDDAIVVVENIHRHMEAKMSALQAAVVSMKEISFAIIVMTVTLAAVYLPLVFQSDGSSVMFREFAWTLAGSVLISGFVALTLTPALCGLFLKHSAKIYFWEYCGSRYRVWLQKALLFPGRIALLLVIIASVGIWGFKQLPSELTPIEDEGYLYGSINVDNAVTNAVREGWYKQVESILKTVPEHERIMTGIWKDQWMWWTLVLKPSKERKRTSKEIAKQLEVKFKNVVGPQVTINDNTNLGSDSSLKIILQYSGDQDTLLASVRKMMADARKLNVFDGLMSEQTWEKARLKVIVDRALASELGVDIDAIEDTLYTFLVGKKATDFNFQGLDYDVQVRAPKALRSEIHDLNSYFVAGKEGQWVPLGSLVTLKEVLEPNEIKHYDRVRGASIVVIMKPDTALEQAIELLEPIVQQHLPPDATFRFGGKAEHYRESQRAMWLTFGLSLSFIYLVLSALFESFVHPFVVLLTVPLSVTGAVLCLLLFGGTNNAYTIIGLVTLIGLITKHGILIVDFANRYRETEPLKEAVVNAAVSRLRPVLITTFAMLCGAIPLVFSIGAGAIARKHIGWIIIGGMTFGTFFSLWVVPVMYTWIGRLKKP